MASPLRSWLALGLLALSPTMADPLGTIDSRNLAAVDERDLYGGSPSICYTYTTEFIFPSGGAGWLGGGPGGGHGPGPGGGPPGAGGPGSGGPGGGGRPGNGGRPGGGLGPGSMTPSFSGATPTASGSMPAVQTVMAVVPGLPFSISLASLLSSPDDQVVSFSEDPPVDWLHYDPVTRSFYGTVPPGQAPGLIIIRVKTVNPTTGQTSEIDIALEVGQIAASSSTTMPPGSSIAMPPGSSMNMPPGSITTIPAGSSAPGGNPTTTSSVPASSVSTGPAQTIIVGNVFAINLMMYLKNSQDTAVAITTSPDTPFLDDGFNAAAKDIAGVVPPGTPAPQTITVTFSAVHNSQTMPLGARQAQDGLYVVQFEVIIRGPMSSATTLRGSSLAPGVSSSYSVVFPTVSSVNPSAASISGSANSSSTAPGGMVPPPLSVPGGANHSATSFPGGVIPPGLSTSFAVVASPSSVPGGVIPPVSSIPGGVVPSGSSNSGGIIPPVSSIPGGVIPTSSPISAPNYASSASIPFLFSSTSSGCSSCRFTASNLPSTSSVASATSVPAAQNPPSSSPAGLTSSPAPSSVSSAPSLASSSISSSQSASSSSGVPSFPSPMNVSSLAPLSCQGPSYETQSKVLYAVNLITGASVPITVAVSADTTNALAYHPQENYLYAVSQNNHNYGYIIRIGAGGVHENTTFTIPQTNPTGSSATSMTMGDIDVNLQFWLGYDNGNGWVQVDLNSAHTATYGQVVNSSTANRGNYLVSDWAYLPGYPNKLWALGQQVVSAGSSFSTWLMYFDLTTKAWTNYFQFQGINGGSGGMAQWGAIYTATDGYLYGLENNSGQIWKFKIDSPTQADAVFVSQGPPGSTNDGARCMLSSNLNATLTS